MKIDENSVTEAKKDTINNKKENLITKESVLYKSDLEFLDPDDFFQEFFSDENEEHNEIDDLDHKKHLDLTNKEGKDSDNLSNILNVKHKKRRLTWRQKSNAKKRLLKKKENQRC